MRFLSMKQGWPAWLFPSFLVLTLFMAGCSSLSEPVASPLEGTEPPAGNGPATAVATAPSSGVVTPGLEPSPEAVFSPTGTPDLAMENVETPQVLPDTSACKAPLALTPPNSEGPYYAPGSPERTSLLEEGMAGTPLLLVGSVLTQDCRPVAGAWLDFWQTDAEGVYDNQGYRLRGHQFTGEDGRYSLETILPAEYPGRPPHIHVKVQAPDGEVLTTQLYFPDMTSNTSDSIFRPELIVQLEETSSGLTARFDFVLPE